jgi:hypothetical protein
MQRVVRFTIACGLGVAIATVLSLTATAHEHRDIADGQYAVTIGFIDEPAFVGEKNGLYLHIEKEPAPGEAASPPAGTEAEESEGTPVEGLAATLQTEVIFGDQRMALPLTPAFGEPGVYESVFFPMAEGDYTFHIVGQIEGVAVDESFTSSPEGFASVQSREPLEFPKPSASIDMNVVSGSAQATPDGGRLPQAGLIGAAAVVTAAALVFMQRRVANRRAMAVQPAR